MQQEEQEPALPEWFSTSEGRRFLLLQEEGLICGICYTELTQPEEIAKGVCQECLPDLELETPVTGEGRPWQEGDELPF